MGEIPPQREIWSRSDGSHPKVKSGQEATDPTPKRNLVKELQIPPRREIWSRSNRSHPEEKSGQGVTDPTPKRNIVKKR